MDFSDILFSQHISKLKIIGTGIVAQWVKLLSTTPASHVPAQVLAAPLMILFPNKCSWKISRKQSEYLAPCTHVGDPAGAPSCWLWFGPALGFVAILGVNQQVKDFSSSLSPLLYILSDTTFQIDKSIFSLKQILTRHIILLLTN